MVIKSTFKFKKMCMDNEHRLIEYLKDVNERCVYLKKVVDRDRLAEVVTREHNYYNDKNEMSTLKNENESVSNETSVDINKEILRLCWGEDPLSQVDNNNENEGLIEKAISDDEKQVSLVRYCFYKSLLF